MDIIQDVLIYQTQMMRNSSLGPYVPADFSPPEHIVTVNALFYASLGFMILAAFIAMLIKSWVREFDRGLRAMSLPEQRAKAREFRYLGMERWKLPEMVGMLPLLIQISLLLFAIGLGLFLFHISKLSFGVTTAIFGVGVLYYAITTSISVFVTSSPFHSPLSRTLGKVYQHVHAYFYPDVNKFQSPTMDMTPATAPDHVRWGLQANLPPLASVQEPALQLPPSAPLVPTAVQSSDVTAGVSPARSTRPGRRAPVPVDDYRWVDQGTGLRHSLNISSAGLPLFPGQVAQAFQAFQGPNPSPLELTRRTWLLYRGRREGDLWKNAVAAAREVRHKVILPRSLLLLLELDDLPRNEWEDITYLWTTSAEPLLSISPGIRLNPQGFAGLDNHDIDTADLIRMWTSGNTKLISKACGQQKGRHDVKNAFHIALTSPNLWSTGVAVLHPWEPSTNLKRLRYIGKLEPATIAAWLRDEVGLHDHDVSCRFKPFSFRAFDTDANTNPRKSHTDLVLQEIHPGPTDDSLPEFGVDLPWTPAHGPRGPPLKSSNPVDSGQLGASSGAADAPDTPMEA